MLLVSEPVLGADEKAALAAVIDSGWVTMGDRVREFELTSSSKPVLQHEQHLRPGNSEVQALLADCTSFAKATGWPPQVPLRRGLESTVDWWSRRLSAKQVRPSRDFIT
jgi:nucleoside-diphosphate-sugar epimerase